MRAQSKGARLACLYVCDVCACMPRPGFGPGSPLPCLVRFSGCPSAPGHARLLCCPCPLCQIPLPSCSLPCEPLVGSCDRHAVPARLAAPLTPTFPARIPFLFTSSLVGCCQRLPRLPAPYRQRRACFPPLPPRPFYRSVPRCHVS